MTTTNTRPLVLLWINEAGPYREALIVAALFAKNLARFLAGRPLRETVDRATGY